MKNIFTFLLISLLALAPLTAQQIPMNIDSTVTTRSEVKI